ncbi:MAG: Holliday junction resolvase-like protein [Patescibacteria group bacterium]
MWKIILIFVILIVILVILYWRTQRQLKELKWAKKSQSSRYGKMTEQFLPFLEDYPYDPQNFRFLGTPVDGIQFEKDKILFIEFKTADSQMSGRQKEIKELVDNKKVEFEEHRIM